MTDLLRILSRLQPETDGEPRLARRTAILTAVNGDGTVQIDLSGVDVQARALSGWNMQIGATVQVLVERGDLLVLGEAVGSSGGTFITNITQGVMPFGAADTLVCMAHGIPFTPDPAHFQITARNDPGSTLHWWVDSTDPTDVCIQLDQAPGADLDLAWRHIGGPVPYGCADNADIIHDGWAYHVFTAPGTFTPTTPGLFDVLVVAGGGGGGGARGYAAAPSGNKPPAGGGGGGGVIAQTEWAINGATAVTVGAGGAGGSPDGASSGGDSILDVLTAIGGGHGGDGFTPPGTGGSGGGSARDFGGGGGSTGASGTVGQGNAGGDGGTASNTSAGGGGGAGAVGTSGATTPANPAGGDGIYVAEFDAPGLGSPQGWFGGGGGGGRYQGAGGGTGGAGGGGNGNAPNAEPGIDGTGGGGAGSTSIAFGVGYEGGDGGDGIVIIRHPVCTPS